MDLSVEELIYSLNLAILDPGFKQREKFLSVLDSCVATEETLTHSPTQQTCTCPVETACKHIVLQAQAWWDACLDI